MKSKVISFLLLSTVMAASINGCGDTSAVNSGDTASSEEQITVVEQDKVKEQAEDEDTSEEQEADEESSETTADADSTSEEASAANSDDVVLPATYEELIDSLHAGQSYTYAPIVEGEDALLVTSDAFNNGDDHMATYEATIFIEKDGSLKKVTTVQSGGTAYPMAVTKDNNIILCMRNSVQKAYIEKETGDYVITKEANVNYMEAEEGVYHNYIKDAAEVPADSSLYDELSEEYYASEVLDFKSAGISPDGTPNLAGGVYKVYTGDEFYNLNSYMAFNSENSGSTQTPDGLSGLPFEYELNADEITFHMGSADDTSVARFNGENQSYPTLTFTGESAFGSDTVTLQCIGNANPETFDATTYFDNDSFLLMKVNSFDETSLTGDLYHEERIKKDIVENAKEGDILYSVDGTQFTVISFEDVNKAIDYSTDEEFKQDVIGTTRFDKFLVKCSTDDFYYALQKEDYEEEYKVVAMMHEENLKKLLAENVTYKIKPGCEIILQKFVSNGESMELTEEYTIGREFKGDNYPEWSADATEYYLTTGMLAYVGVVDGEIYNIVQVYVP